jgi:Transcriptional regulator, AbiEi antitoxin
MADLGSLPSTFSAGEARARGVHPRELYEWRDSGEVIELSRGVFRKADAPQASFPDLLAVARRAPRAIVCCVTAAAAYDLTDEQPVKVQIAVANRTHPPRIDYPPTKVFRFDPDTFELGLDRLEAAPGEWVRVYDAARTVTDLMRLRHRLGEPLALGALNRYLDLPGARPALLLGYARTLDVLGPMRHAVDVATAR